MRRFQLFRQRTISGDEAKTATMIAEGVSFSNGRCVMQSVTEIASLAIYRNAEELMQIHNHEGDTELLWLDSTTD